MTDALRRALDNAQLSEDELAARLGVDPKTVRRWVAGRLPYPRHRSSVAAILGLAETDLWPLAPTARPVLQTPAPGVLATYPHRWAVPRMVWLSLFEGARREIGILAYAGLFLAEDMGLLRVIADRAREGVMVRIVLGDPDSPHVSERGDDEGVGDSMGAKIRNSLVLYRPLRDVEGVEIRLHGTVLYNSIYRADDQVLVNPHAYGIAASQAPVLHLRRVEEGDMAGMYIDSFESVWSKAIPVL